jgi:outer membrane receptor protein involved in Fe transport
MRLLRANLFNTAAALTPLLLAQPAFSQEPEDTVAVLDRVVVTGTNIRDTELAASSPIDVLTDEEISASGLATSADLITRLPSNLGSEANSFTFRQNNTLGTAQINLRGLGLGATLVLVNGRRMPLTATFADDGSQFVDINTIPLPVIERVDVVKTGASAIYGSDAVAGVVNFVTRTEFEGVEVSGRLQSAEGDQTDLTASGLFGWQGDRASLVAGATWFDRSSLSFLDRDFTGQGTEIETATSKPGTFILLQPSPVPGFTGLPVRVPIPDPGCAAAGGVVTAPVAGFCAVDTRSQFDLVAEEERFSAFLEGRLAATDRLTLYSELSYADNQAAIRAPKSLPGAGASGSILVAPSNPFNPFRAPVLFVGRPISAEAGFTENRAGSETIRFALGAEFEISDTWRLDAGYVHGQSTFDLVFNDLLRSEFFLPGTTTVIPEFNVFATSITDPALANSQDLIDRLTVEVPFSFESKLDVLDASVTGEIGELGAGPVSFAAGLQYRRTESQTDAPQFAIEPGNLVFIFPFETFGPASTEVNAAFAEVAAPLTDKLGVQLAVRVEDYGGSIGETVDPKVAVTWDATDSLALRASAGTSFRAPTPLQTAGSTNQTAPITNPCTGQRAATAIVTAGNPDLQPEEATTYSIGGVVRTNSLRGSIDYFNYDYTDVITRQSAEALVAGATCLQVAPGVRVPQAAGVLVNAQTGLISRVDVGFINAGAIKTDGVDFNFAYGFDIAGAGSIELGVNGTWVSSFELQEAPGGPVIDAEGQRNITNIARSIPEIRSNFTAKWDREGHQVTGTVRYIDSYTDDQPTNNLAEIDSQTTFDLQYAYRWEQGVLGTGKESRVSIGAINLFNEDPPFVNDRGGYDPLVHDPRGRLIYVSLNQSF